MRYFLTVTALLGAWRRRHPRAFRIGFWYSLGAVSLPLLWLAALGLAPEAGLTRNHWYPVDASTEPIIDERITAIDLAFIDEGNRPTRNYRIRWEGVWFSPRAERVDFYAGADDGVILRVDGDTVLERSPAVGMHTVGRTVELGAGAHRLEIEHWQDGGGRSLNVQWAPAGGAPALLGPTRLFPEDPGALGYWLQVAAVRFPILILLVWATGVAVLVGLTVWRAFYRTVWRAFYRRVTSLGPDERWRRLRTVLFPAVLGPSQLLLFGPWTVHETNRTEFLVGFWELAPNWVWLIGPVVGVLATLGIVMPARWFPRYVAGTVRGRGAALGAGEPAARRLRAPGRRRARPGITRVANAVRSRLVGLRAPARRDIRRQGRSCSARRVRGAGDAAGNRPRGPGRQNGNRRRTLDTRLRDRVAVAAARDL